MIDYSLHENYLTESTDDFVAQTHVKKVYDKEQFIDLMLQRGTLMTKTDALAVLNNIEETTAFIVGNGDGVNLPLFNVGFSLSGVFDGATDSFDPKRHRLHANISKGVVLREAEKQVKLSKINASSTQPQILEVSDSVTGKVDEVLTSGGAVEINGVNIKIAGDNAACGLFFVDENGTETKAVTIIQNKPATLISLIPTLAAGSYQVKITTQYSGSVLLKTPKTTIYGKTLLVG